MRAITIGAILAGGQGRRMGAAKPGVELAGRTLAARAVVAVGSAGLEPIVVAKPQTELPRLDCRVLSQPTEPNHPLTGLLAALRASSGRGVVALACDMPLVPARLLRWLAELDDEVAVPQVDGMLEPLLGRYSPTAIQVLERSLADGDSINDAVCRLAPRIIAEQELARFGDPERILFNIASPEDLRRAEELLEGANLRSISTR